MHRRQAALASIPEPVEYVPASQSWHTPEETAPRVVEKDPALHSTHEALDTKPEPVWKVPPRQLWHVKTDTAPRKVE